MAGRSSGWNRRVSTEARPLIVGGGIAGLAAAALLIRDAGWPGRRIEGLEQQASFGGSGNPAQG
jgi:oleate hydratase